MKTDRSKDYFRLRPECILVRGSARGAIYNLLTGDIFALGRDETCVMAACEENLSLSSIPAIVRWTSEQTKRFLGEVETNGLGFSHEAPVHIEKARDRLEITQELSKQPPRLELAYIEVTGNCDMNCNFCGAANVARRWGCFGCWKHAGCIRESIGASRHLRTLAQLRALECRRLVLRGGNPFLAEECCSMLVSEARALNFEEIFIVTNGVNMTRSMLDLCRNNNVQLILQVVSHRHEMFDSITGVAGSYANFTRSLEAIRNANINFMFNLLVFEATRYERDDMLKHYAAQLPINTIVDYLYQTKGSLTATDVFTCAPELCIDPKHIGRTSIMDFYNKQTGNPCLNGRIAVTLSGDVLPCPIMTKNVLGNVNESRICDIFARGALKPYWKMSRQSLPPCKFCEFRFACSDCRALELGLNGDLHSVSNCIYNPQTGVNAHFPVLRGELIRGDGIVPHLPQPGKALH